MLNWVLEFFSKNRIKNLQINNFPASFSARHQLDSCGVGHQCGGCKFRSSMVSLATPIAADQIGFSECFVLLR
jgi:hypothetical protein